MEDTLIVLASASPIFAALAGFFAGAWWSTHRQVRRLQGLRAESDRDAEEESVHRSLMAIEAQLDRLRDEQDFLSRLVAEGRTKQISTSPLAAESEVMPD